MTLPLLTVLPLTLGDLPLATALLRHLTHLGPIPQHAILFIADPDLPADRINATAELAKPVFLGGGNIIRVPSIGPIPPYPHAHNLRFETAAKHIATNQRTPWLFLTPRCVPVRNGWLQQLEADYNAHANRFPMMGQVFTPAAHGTAQAFVPATAIYPPELPKRALQRLVAQRGTDFELSCADLFVPMTHPTRLIWGDPGENGALPHPPQIAALVVTKRPVEFGAVVRGELTTDPLQPSNETPDAKPETIPGSLSENVAPAATKPGSVETVAAKIEAASTPTSRQNGCDLPPTPSTFYHSGNLGDIIYALAAIKLTGGGRLILGPKQRKTPPAGRPIDEDTFNRLSPLFTAQPYIPRATFSPRHPGTDAAFDLNHYRHHWHDQTLRSRLSIHNLASIHCYTLSCLEKFHPHQTWLTVDPIPTPFFTVHRSPRYHAEGDRAFPWPTLLKRYANRLLFVGLSTEHAAFQREFGVRVDFWHCTDFLTMARVIAGSLGFIGNQSFPMALALGLGQRVLQEQWPTSPDCTFPRPNFLHQPFTTTDLARWETSTL